MKNEAVKPVLSETADITIEKAEHLKGIALVFLFWHHLFGCNYLEDWMSLAKDANIMLGVSGRICIAMFLFCSGYGLYKSYISKENIKRSYIPQKVISTLVPYWMIMIISIVILIILGKFNPFYIPINLVAWVHDDDILYVSFSWYIKLQLLLLITLPLIRFIEKKWKKNFILDFLKYVILPFIIWFFLKDFGKEGVFEGALQSLASTVLFLLFWHPLFALGMIFAKYGIYSNTKKFTERFPAALVIIISLMVCGFILFMRYLVSLFYQEVSYYSITDVICMPLFTTACLHIIDNMKIKSRYVLPFIGKNSLYY